MTVQIISRAEWQARAPQHEVADEPGLFDPRTNPSGWLIYNRPLTQVLRTLVIHHSAIAPTFDVAAIQRLHIEQRGFADIAYHFVIDAEAKIFEGRAINARGAHVAGANTGSVGIVLLGNFEESAPPESQWQALSDLIGYLKDQYPSLTHLAGHHDFNLDSVCPGANVYPRLPGLAQAQRLQYGVGGYQRPLY